VFDFTVESGTIRIDQDPGLHVELPETADFFSADLDHHDDDAEITEAEHH
jgi:alpha-acetolactate decarboxylase